MSNMSRLNSLFSKYEQISKLNAKIHTIKELMEQENEQYKDLLSELEVINSLERLIGLKISNENIDQKLSNSSSKDMDIVLVLDRQKIFFEVMNLINVDTQNSSSTKDGVTVSNSSEWIRKIRQKILHKTQDKTIGLDINDYNTPIVLVFGPYSDDWITFQIGYIVQALQSEFTANLNLNLVIPDDPEFNPYKQFNKVKHLLSGVLVTRFTSRKDELDLNLWFVPNLQCKVENRLQERIIKKINNENNRKRFSFNIIAPKYQVSS